MYSGVVAVGHVFSFCPSMFHLNRLPLVVLDVCFLDPTCAGKGHSGLQNVLTVRAFAQTLAFSRSLLPHDVPMRQRVQLTKGGTNQ
jgi:hypothetical protein